MKLNLSITLLISDRPQMAERCLNSLVPILQAVPSELIVVYTGKGTESLDIVKRYTDHIILFDWCDDFSAARNAGLKEATGDWFLYIDDDEWFEDSTDIVSFFLKGEYRQFQTAWYRQRNYQDLQGISYYDVWVARMVKRTGETGFSGKIHESLAPLRGPYKFLDVYAHHFGYVSSSNQRKNLRFDRNVPLLEDELKKNPHSMKIYMQLAQEYMVDEKYEQAEQYCINLLELDRQVWNDSYADWAQVMLVKSISAQGDDLRALEAGRNILRSAKIRQVSSAMLIILLLPMCVNLRKYEEGIQLTHTFHDLKTELDAHPVFWQEQQILDINQEAVIENLYPLYMNAISCCLHIGDFEEAVRYLDCFPWNTQQMEERFYDFFEDCKEQCGEQGFEWMEAVAKVDTEDTYVLFQKALVAENARDIEIIREFYELCSKTANGCIRYQVILMALRNGFMLPEFINDMDLDAWRRCASQVVEKAEFEAYEQYSMKVQFLFFKHPLYLAILDQKILPRLLLRQEIEDQEFHMILHKYCDVVLKLNHSLYHDELFEDSMQYCLPLECRVALAIDRAIRAIEEGDCHEGLRQMRNVVQRYPSSAVLVKRIVTQLERQYKKEAGGEQSEFQILAIQIKGKLKELIETGQYREAFSVAEQLSVLLPGDLEVMKWKTSLYEYK